MYQPAEVSLVEPFLSLSLFYSFIYLFFNFLSFLLLSASTLTLACLLSARRLTKPDRRVGLCPTLLYLEDPETPGTTKVTGRPLQPDESSSKQTTTLRRCFQQRLRLLRDVNRSHDPSQWERTDLEVILAAAIDLIMCCK